MKIVNVKTDGYSFPSCHMMDIPQNQTKRPYRWTEIRISLILVSWSHSFIVGLMMSSCSIGMRIETKTYISDEKDETLGVLSSLVDDPALLVLRS